MVEAPGLGAGNQDAANKTKEAVAAMPPLSTATMQRLAFIRYLYSVGIEQTRQPEPMAAIAILSRHDAVELFLHLVAEHRNVNLGKRPDFTDYVGLIAAEIKPDRLGQAAAMKRLNSARVELKHSAILPSRHPTEQLGGDTTRFFEDNSPLIFGLSFHDISLVDLVSCELARMRLKVASEKLATDDTAAAMVAIATAFGQLTDDYEKRASTRYGKSPFSFGESFDFDSSFSRGRQQDPFAAQGQAQFEDKLMSAVVALQNAMKAFALGLDYRRHATFQRLTPVIRRMWGGRYTAAIGQGLADSPTWPPSPESCRFCFDFVIDVALRLQDFDFGMR